MSPTARVRLVAALVPLAICAGPAAALGQQSRYPESIAGIGASATTTARNPLAPDLSSLGYEQHPAAANVLHTSQPPADWDSWRAEVDAELAAIATQQAAARQQAADVPSLKVGGRIMLDWALFDQSPQHRATYGDWGDRCEVRRARIGVWGEAFYVVEYALEVDFADTPAAPADGSIDTGLDQSTSFKDAYIALKELPWLGRLSVGHLKEPFGLEYANSTRFTAFMERSMCDEGVFVPGRNLGIMISDHSRNQRMTWAIGAFRSEMGAEPVIRSNEFEGGTALTIRCTCLPWYDEASNGRGLIHLGTAYSYRDLDDGTVRLRAQPEAHLADVILDTGSLAATNWQIAGGEFALVYGPFSVQSEVFAAWIDSPVYGDVQYDGAYVFVSCFLTGEHRSYRRSAGCFSRTKPFESFFRVRDADGHVQMGTGAWEVAYRYSTVDLNDAVAGGRAYNHTIGLNWYLNPYVRLMFNYVDSHVSAEHKDGTDSTVDVFETRFQIDF